MAASQRFGEIVGMLADKVDLVIIDSPPLLEVGDTAAMAAKTDGVLFVVNMARVKWPMLERAHAQLMQFPSRRLGLVVIAAKSVHKPVYGYERRGAQASSEDGSSGLG
jgi:Mrp family chromosome partitioning ATPase